MYVLSVYVQEQLCEDEVQMKTHSCLMSELVSRMNCSVNSLMIDCVQS
jgi:hypothetical protein